jgi:peptide/nickel transport system permease protein
MVYARMTRGVVLSVRERPFVEAAEMVGARPRRVVARHVLPNLFTPLATLAVLEFARIILAEAALSFLGLGIQYPGVTWGLDIARAGDHELFGNQWLIIYPGLLLSLTVLAVNLLSSWLRVVLDPQEREKRFASTVQSKGGAEL